MTPTPLPGDAWNRDLHVLFVCTANICRSPLAEAWMRQLSASAGLGVQVDSASVDQVVRPPHPIIAELVAHGPGGETRPSRPLDGRLVEWADLIVPMTGRHALAIAGRHRDARSKIFTLDHLASIIGPIRNGDVDAWLGELRVEPRRYPNHPGTVDVRDPIGQDRAIFDAVDDQIQTLVRRIVSVLADASDTNRDAAIVPTWLDPA